MSIREATFYAVQCDYPGCDYDTSDIGEFSAWMDRGDAVEQWTESDNLCVHQDGGPDRHYCFKHTVWDENEYERTPLPEGIEGAFILAERRIRMKIDLAAERALQAHLKRCSDWQLRDAVKWQGHDARVATDRLRESTARTFAEVPEVPEVLSAILRA